MAVITHEQKDSLLHTVNISQTPTRNSKVLVLTERLQTIHLSTDANNCVWVFAYISCVTIS